MGESERLTAKQARFCAALLEARSIREAARMAGVAESTAWRFLSRSEVRRALSERQAAILAQAAAALATDMAQAREVLRAIMGNPQAAPGVRVAAARAVLEAGLRLFELVTLSERVAVLEEHLEVRDVAETD
ncbi:MAG: hypothetical protein H5T84_08860 [Thermoleophilia bacterium]|nr:hypothetical protein [Thermoleophilia bacterium]